MGLKYTPVIALFFILISSTNSKAQCPTIKKITTENNTISLALSQTKNTFAILYKIENGQPFAELHNEAVIIQNKITFNAVIPGNYIIRISEKGCPPLFIGKEENIIVQ